MEQTEVIGGVGDLTLKQFNEGANVIEDLSLKQLAEAMSEAKSKKEWWTKEHTILKDQLLRRMVDLELDSLRTDSGLTVSLSVQTSAKIQPEMLEEVVAWFKQIGEASIFKHTVHNKTLSATVNNLIEEGVDLPIGLDVETVNILSLRSKQ